MKWLFHNLIDFASHKIHPPATFTHRLEYLDQQYFNFKMSATTQPILPVVGPQRGELPENEKHRRGILRVSLGVQIIRITLTDTKNQNVPLTPGPEQFHGISNPTSVQCYMIATIQGILHHSRVAQFCRYHHIGPRSARPKQERLEQHIRVTYEVLMSNCGYCQLYELLVRYWTRPFENEQDREIEVNSRFQKLFERYLGKQFHLLRKLW